MAGDNGLSFDGFTHGTETTTHTTMANGGADQFFFFLLTPENGWVNILLAVGTIFVNRVRLFLTYYVL